MKEEQFIQNEQKLEKILDSLEPGNYKQLIDFADNAEAQTGTRTKEEQGTFFDSFYDLVMLALCYFCYKRCGENSKRDKTKIKILSLLKEIKAFGISDNIEDYIEVNGIDHEKVMLKSFMEFKSFIEGDALETLEAFDVNLCKFLQIISSAFNITITSLAFMNFCAAVDTPEEFWEIFNTVVLYYFMNYIELTKNYKSTVHENLERLNKKKKKSILDSNLFLIISHKYVTAEELKKYFYYGLLFYSFENEHKEQRFVLAKRIFEKVFFNESPVINVSGKECPVKNAWIFRDTAAAFSENLQDNYGVVICMFLLLGEIGFDDFSVLFSNIRAEEKADTDAYYLQEIELFLKRWHEQYDKSNNLDLKKLFSPYEKDLLDCTNLQQYVTGKQYVEIPDRVKADNTTILPAMLFFAVYSICGSYNVDVYADTTEKERYAKKETIESPFYDAIINGSWMSPKKQFSIYNNVAKEFDFEGFDFEKTFPFAGFSFEALKDNWAIINLLYAVTRRQVDSKEFLLRQMNLLREKQKKKYPVNKDSKGIIHEVYKAINSQKKLKKLDCGFKVKNFVQNFYPFSSVFFAERFKSAMLLKRDVICKFIYETDFDIIHVKNSKGVLNYKEMNRKSLSTRYLYKDRNMATHFSLHSNVESLLNPKNWENLVYALCDFEEEILVRIYDNDYAKHDYVYNRHRDDPIFFVYHYINNELTDLLRILRMKLCEIAGIPFKLWTNKTNEEAIKSYKKFIDSNKYRITKDPDYSSEDYKKDGIMQSDKLFLPRLRSMLNVMFAVNGTNDDGLDHNTSVVDFYDRYYAQIAFYLFYLTICFSK